MLRRRDSIKYWRFNPGQDTVDFRESPPDPVHNVKSAVRRSISSASRGRSGSRSRNGSDGDASQFREKPIAPNERPDGDRLGEPPSGMRPNDSAV